MASDADTALNHHSLTHSLSYSPLFPPILKLFSSNSMSSTEDYLQLLLLLQQKRQNLFRYALVLRKRQLLATKRWPRFWVHDIIRRRSEQGAFHHLVRELELDREKYREYFRRKERRLRLPFKLCYERKITNGKKMHISL